MLVHTLIPPLDHLANSDLGREWLTTVERQWINQYFGIVGIFHYVPITARIKLLTIFRPTLERANVMNCHGI